MGSPAHGIPCTDDSEIPERQNAQTSPCVRKFMRKPYMLFAALVAIAYLCHQSVTSIIYGTKSNREALT